jgi:hypothetical protein
MDKRPADPHACSSVTTLSASHVSSASIRAAPLPPLPPGRRAATSRDLSKKAGY